MYAATLSHTHPFKSNTPVLLFVLLAPTPFAVDEPSYPVTAYIFFELK